MILPTVLHVTRSESDRRLYFVARLCGKYSGGDYRYYAPEKSDPSLLWEAAIRSACNSWGLSGTVYRTRLGGGLFVVLPPEQPDAYFEL